MLACVDCCDPNGLDRVFTGRLVRRELRAFRRGGLNRRQQEIVALLEPLESGSSVLDIGCGIGAIGTTLLAGGAGSGLFVDVSSAYLNAAREVGAEAGIGERAAFYRDDFATSARPYPGADVVVLDRVVCCYPDAQALLEKAARHSQRTLVFSYPRPFWFAPLFRALCALAMKLAGQEYRFFLHDPQLLLRAATSAGHGQVMTRPVGLWQLVKVSKTLRACHQISEEDIDGSEMNSGEEVTGGFVITCGDGAEVLKLEKEVLDEVPIFVSLGVIAAGCKPVSFRRDNRFDPFFFEDVKHPLLSVVSFVGK